MLLLQFTEDRFSPAKFHGKETLNAHQEKAVAPTINHSHSALTCQNATDTVLFVGWNLLLLPMLESIEKLLILQDRDRKISRVKNELARIEPERRELQSRAANTQTSLDAAKLRVKKIETERKDLELQVEAQKQKIAKYSIQQFETKKNEEFKAIGHEIESCKKTITEIEDKEIELMEQAEAAQKEVVAATQLASEAKKHVDGQITELNGREENLKKELDELSANREELAAAVDESARSRYERLLKQKGENVVVGIQHGVCGGCHMKFPQQIVVSCRREEELVTCPNCGRILYYTRDMDLAVAD